MNHTGPQQQDIIKFVIMSIVGVFLFMTPIPDGEGAFNIPLGYAINWLGTLLNSIDVGGFGFLFFLAARAQQGYDAKGQ